MSEILDKYIDSHTGQNIDAARYEEKAAKLISDINRLNADESAESGHEMYGSVLTDDYEISLAKEAAETILDSAQLAGCDADSFKAAAEKLDLGIISEIPEEIPELRDAIHTAKEEYVISRAFAPSSESPHLDVLFKNPRLSKYDIEYLTDASKRDNGEELLCRRIFDELISIDYDDFAALNTESYINNYEYWEYFRALAKDKSFEENKEKLFSGRAAEAYKELTETISLVLEFCYALSCIRMCECADILDIDSLSLKAAKQAALTDSANAQLWNYICSYAECREKLSPDLIETGRKNLETCINPDCGAADNDAPEDLPANAALLDSEQYILIYAGIADMLSDTGIGIKDEKEYLNVHSRLGDALARMRDAADEGRFAEEFMSSVGDMLPLFARYKTRMLFSTPLSDVQINRIKLMGQIHCLYLEMKEGIEKPLTDSNALVNGLACKTINACLIKIIKAGGSYKYLAALADSEQIYKACKDMSFAKSFMEATDGEVSMTDKAKLLLMDNDRFIESMKKSLGKTSAQILACSSEYNDLLKNN